MVQLALDSLEQATESIFAGPPDIMTLDYVESVAKFRYTLETTAWLLHDYYLNLTKFNALSKDEKKAVIEFISSVENRWLVIKGDETEVVANLLIKYVVRKYGMSTLIALCDKTKTEGLDFSWLMKHLQKDSGSNQVRFPMYILKILSIYLYFYREIKQLTYL